MSLQQQRGKLEVPVHLSMEIALLCAGFQPSCQRGKLPSPRSVEKFHLLRLA